MEAAMEPGTTPRTRSYGVMLVLLAGTFWSIGGIVVRLIMEANAWQIVFYRSLSLAMTLALVVLIRYQGNFWNALRSAGVIAAVAGGCLSVSFVCWIFALMYTTVANALFLLTTQTFLTALLAFALLGERVPRITWLTMSLATIGVGVMLSEGLALGTLSGNLFALGAAFGLSGFTVALRKGKEVDMFPATWWAGIFSTVFAACMLQANGLAFSVGVWDLGMCTILGVVQIGCGLIAFTAGSYYLPAAELALLALTEVILGPIWVWLGVGEVPSAWTLVGGMIMLVAVIWRALYEVRRQSSRPHIAPA
ncbi:MAG: DMT family transporter [Candidatus Tectomicrobia bacterium]|nr:DMT family transporter [Candidatus Tectomicrobia bacterium]